jgi:maleylpyruvate isomerase
MDATKRAHKPLLETISSLNDDAVREPSLLPGWSRAHLLTHLARNADSHVRMLTGAVRDEQWEQYEGGAEGRAADIEAGANRTAAELIADLQTSAEKMFEMWESVPTVAWDREVKAIHGRQPAWFCVFSRWRETEIHHVDLDMGYTLEDWDEPFVRATMPNLVDSLTRRLPEGSRLEIRAPDIDFEAEVGVGATCRVTAPGAVLVAWLTGRPFDRDRLEADAGLFDLGPWA